MKIFKLVVMFTILLSLTGYSEIEFDKDWKSALKNGKETGKRIFIDFYTDWCPPCKKLNKTTFKDKAMEDYFKKENFIVLKVNPEKDREAEKYFKVFAYPTLLVFNTKGVEVDRILGYRTADELIAELNNIKNGIGTLPDLQSKLKKDPNNYELMFRITNKYIARADFAGAINILDTVIKKDDQNSKGKASMAVYKKGYVYFKWKKKDEAIKVLLSVQKRFPKSKEAVDGFFSAYYYAKKFGYKKRAVDILIELTKKYPDNKYYKEYKKELNL